MLTPARLTTLRALADTFIPAGPAPASPPPGSALVDFDKLAAAIQAQPLGAQAEFGQLLDILHQPLAGLTWWGPLRPFHALAPAQRERLLQSWAGSRLGPLRQGFQALRKLCTFLYYGDSPADGSPNPAWAALGYPGPCPRPTATRPAPPSARCGR
ncbi:hypothetical protein GKZ68_16160 [Hymenobacter sp. BRD128]|uniref:hypothetical protein n=1 Tax=Hymenobacter sp. BRD128 TaxID=2675878 RepID=UPI001566E41F|nr:hypothetical protein [Hymenobacter sp. BRD128]QKG58017.1 hypothetical protein GKZ68_16160 [Hymenobacter sp. BRD128]